MSYKLFKTQVMPFVRIQIFDLRIFRFDGQQFRSIGSSKYSHQAVYGMSNYLGQALTTGCKDTSNGCGVKTELMDMETFKWTDGPDYPFGR